MNFFSLRWRSVKIIYSVQLAGNCLRIALIKPSLGSRNGVPYRTPAALEPLIIALIAGQTPPGVELVFIDERLEDIDFSQQYDLVAVTTETFTALRAYQISSEFRRRGCRVILGGFHPTLLPAEALKYADSVAIGEVEGIWPEVIHDLAFGKLKREYRSNVFGLTSFAVNRSIFAGKKYLPLHMVETSRGCRFNCNFCSVHSFYGDAVTHRDFQDVVKEIKALRSRFVFFADDNIVSDPQQAMGLFRAIRPLGITWASQASITSATDPAFLDEMYESGCRAVIIGLESLKAENLRSMKKGWMPDSHNVEKLLDEFRRRGIMVYGTFVFGYRHDTPAVIKETVDFAIEQKLFMANFNMLYPFPGTPVYNELAGAGRLLLPQWWISRDFRWDYPAFIPESMSADELADSIRSARLRFNSISSIARRAFDLQANMATPLQALLYFAGNIFCRQDIKQKTGIRPGYNGCPNIGD